MPEVKLEKHWVILIRPMYKDTPYTSVPGMYPTKELADEAIREMTKSDSIAHVIIPSWTKTG